jgi:putative transposase
VVQIAPGTYHAAKSRQPSARALRDVVMMPALMVLWVADRNVYGRP